MIQMTEDHTWGHSDLQFTAARERSSNGEYAGNFGSEFNKEEIKSGGTSRLKLRLMDRNLYSFLNSCGKSIFPPDANTCTVMSPCTFCVVFFKQHS